MMIDNLMFLSSQYRNYNYVLNMLNFLVSNFPSEVKTFPNFIKRQSGVKKEQN